MLQFQVWFSKLQLSQRAQRGCLGQSNHFVLPQSFSDSPALLLWLAGLYNTVTAEKGPSWQLPRTFNVASCPGDPQRQRELVIRAQGGFLRSQGQYMGRAGVQVPTGRTQGSGQGQGRGKAGNNVEQEKQWVNRPPQKYSVVSAGWLHWALPILLDSSLENYLQENSYLMLNKGDYLNEKNLSEKPVFPLLLYNSGLLFRQCKFYPCL